ncbi:hypothetical protein ARMSODRAFT_1008767 [Armillaria solidipes]|uniref:Uncharacterized protein n=1 Tax=Armillaria solidipes TaxID=1076256 RepID=A0A2H3AUY9_9AGAR|nr:hypothetical protein ARMSODRAFT_1008767 [Armillaria solidipes]
MPHSSSSSSVTVAGESYSSSLSLHSPGSYQTSNVHTTGRGAVLVIAATDIGTVQTSMQLEMREGIHTDIVLGFDWFCAVATDPSVCLGRSMGLLKVMALLELYQAMACPTSSLFIPPLDHASVVALMFHHGVVLGTSCIDYPRFRHQIMSHLLTGRCASQTFSGCSGFVRASRDAGVFPHIFLVSSVVHSGVIDHVGSEFVGIYAELFAAHVNRNVRRQTMNGAAARCSALRFDRLTLDEYRDILAAHGVQCHRRASKMMLREAISNHLFLVNICTGRYKLSFIVPDFQASMHIVQISDVPVSLSTTQGLARTRLPSQWLTINGIFLPSNGFLPVMVDGPRGIATVVVSVEADYEGCGSIGIGEDIELAYDIVFPASATNGTMTSEDAVDVTVGVVPNTSNPVSKLGLASGTNALPYAQGNRKALTSESCLQKEASDGVRIATLQESASGEGSSTDSAMVGVKNRG